jgi:hypothetical protein
MSRSLRIAELPSMQPLVRFSGYLTSPVSDAQIADALAPFLMNTELWRSAAALPRDWLVRDDSILLAPPAGVTPIWGQGNAVASATNIGDPETPWRLLIGDGQLAIANVWLYDPRAAPWLPPTDCPRPPRPGLAAPPTPTAPSTGAVGALVAFAAVAAGAATLWWRSRHAPSR